MWVHLPPEKWTKIPLCRLTLKLGKEPHEVPIDWHPVGPTSFLCHINDRQPESQRLHTFVTTIISKRLINPSTKSKTTKYNDRSCEKLLAQVAVSYFIDSTKIAVYRYSFLFSAQDHQLKHFGSGATVLRHRRLYATNLSQILHCATLQHRHSFLRTIKASLFTAWL